MADCAVCSRPLPDTAYVGPCCERTLASQLRDTAALWPELQTTVAGQARLTDPGPRARGYAPPQPIRPGLGDPAADHQLGAPDGLPFRWTAAEVAYAVRNTVTTWARVVLAEHLGFRDPVPRINTPWLTKWLARQLGWMRYQPWAAECWDELGYACRLVVPVVDRPRPRLDAGPCLAATDTGPCGNRLSTVAGAAIVHCRVCGAAHTTQQRRDTILAAARPTLGTPAELSAWLTILGEPLPVGTIYSWISRSRLLAHGVDREGNATYLFGEVRDLQVAGRGRRERITA